MESLDSFVKGDKVFTPGFEMVFSCLFTSSLIGFSPRENVIFFLRYGIIQLHLHPLTNSLHSLKMALAWKRVG